MRAHCVGAYLDLGTTVYSQTVSFSNLLLALTISLAAAACTMSSVDDGALVEASCS